MKNIVELTIIVDVVNNKTMIGKSAPHPDGPWGDLALVLEGLGVLFQACLAGGKTEHNGQPIDDYVKSYVDKVYADYQLAAKH